MNTSNHEVGKSGLIDPNPLAMSPVRSVTTYSRRRSFDANYAALQQIKKLLRSITLSLEIKVDLTIPQTCRYSVTRATPQNGIPTTPISEEC